MKFEDWKNLMLSSDVSDRTDAADELPDDGDDEDVVALLNHALQDDDELVRTCAAGSLGNCCTKSARHALRAAIPSESDEIALGYMLGSLGMIGEEEDFETLVRRFTDQSLPRRVRINSAEGIAHLALNVVLPFITSEYVKSHDEFEDVGLPAIQRIVAHINKEISHIDRVARTRLPNAKRVNEIEELNRIVATIKERIED
jgi:hypothetical protein